MIFSISEQRFNYCVASLTSLKVDMNIKPLALGAKHVDMKYPAKIPLSVLNEKGMPCHSKKTYMRKGITLSEAGETFEPLNNKTPTHQRIEENSGAERPHPSIPAAARPLQDRQQI